MPRIAEEYRTIASGAGWIDRSGLGRLRFEGRDAASFLQALVTNDLAGVAAGQGVYAAYLTPQGRMIADLRILRFGDHLLAEVAAGIAAALAARLELLIFAEDVRVRDVSAGVAVLRVVGARAPDVVASLLDLPRAGVEGLPPLGHLTGVNGLFVVKADDTVEAAFDLWMPAERREGIAAAIGAAGAIALSQEMGESLRVAAGRPAFGQDMTPETIPLEAGLLDRAISTTKGCYVGQEVIIRVLHRGGGRVARRLVRLVLDDVAGGVPPAGAGISAGGTDVGRVTSAAWAPDGKDVLALGYVSREIAETSAPVSIAMPAGLVPARIVGLAG